MIFDVKRDDKLKEKIFEQGREIETAYKKIAHWQGQTHNAPGAYGYNTPVRPPPKTEAILMRCNSPAKIMLTQIGITKDNIRQHPSNCLSGSLYY